MPIGKIRIKTLVKFLNLCYLILEQVRLPTIQEIVNENNCCKGHAYNYLRALKYLYPEDFLDLIRDRQQDNSVQQVLS